ncbi:hypothetical protein H0H93_010805, partial [Arthromyces matolae]
TDVPIYIREMPPVCRTIQKNGLRTPFLVLAVPFPAKDIMKFSERNGLEDKPGFSQVIVGLKETTRLLKNCARLALVYSPGDPEDTVTAFYFAHNGSQQALDLARNADTLEKIHEVLGVKYDPVWVYKERK